LLAHWKGTVLLQRFSHIPQASVLSVIDILIVAFLIYEFLKLIKGTRAVPMLSGVILLAIAFYIAHVEPLRTVDWLLTTLLPYAIFALIVVFGAEIRHVLARLGRRMVMGRLGAGAADSSYDDIVLAAKQFSENLTGALIVIEREIGLRTYIESGVPLDAHLSFDLLTTIFRPSAPLHDGAVIIQKDRIAAAACFLPLSMKPLSSQLGTRHRAAIGITEESDAISVVVSEETGGISIAVGGEIKRNIDSEELRQRLSQLLSRYVPQAALPTQISDTALTNDEQEFEPFVQEKDLREETER
jgi:diadenylate cyclase